MTGPMRSGAMAVVLALWSLATSPAAEAARLADYFGSYVGTAEVVDLPEGDREHRHMDIVIEPFAEGGFAITWTNVTLVDGRRDVPGVIRRVEQVQFQPVSGSGGGLFVAAEPRSLFREREPIAPMEGHPVRWASLRDDALAVYSFVVTGDGRYELQAYERRLTVDGLEILFERVVDDEVRRRITGTTVRARER